MSEREQAKQIIDLLPEYKIGRILLFLKGVQFDDELENENQPAIIDLREKLAVAEKEIADGAEGEDFLAVAKQLREGIHGTEL